MRSWWLVFSHFCMLFFPHFNWGWSIRLFLFCCLYRLSSSAGYTWIPGSTTGWTQSGYWRKNQRAQENCWWYVMQYSLLPLSPILFSFRKKNRQDSNTAFLQNILFELGSGCLTRWSHPVLCTSICSVLSHWAKLLCCIVRSAKLSNKCRILLAMFNSCFYFSQVGTRERELVTDS